MLTRSGPVMVALASLLLALAGCGGAGGGASAGEGGGFKLTIQWPTPDRHIPSLATRIHLSIDQSGVPVPGGEVDLNKPTDGSTTTSVVLKDLPVTVPLSFHARAYAPSTGTDEPLLGTVDSTVTLEKGLTNIVILDLATTVDHLTVTSPDFEAGTLTLAPTKGSQLVVEGHAAGTSGALVPIDTTKLRFAAAGTGFTVSETGFVQGTAFGEGSIDVSDLDSGKITNVPVSIKSPVRTLEVGTAGAFSIVNHNSALALRPLIKALDKNGDEVTGAKFTYTVTGPGLTVDSATGLLKADEGVVFANGTIATGTIVVGVVDSDLTAQANIDVQAHDAVISMVLGPDSFATQIDFSVIANFISANVVTTATPADSGDFEVVANDKFGNQVPLAVSDMEFSIPASAMNRYSLTPITIGTRIDVIDFDHTASTNLTVTHKATGTKLVIKVKTGGVI